MADISTIWRRRLAPLADRQLSILEIGSFIGGSAVRFMNLLPKATILCVDPFTGDLHGGVGYNGEVETIESRFDTAVAPFGARVHKLKSASVTALYTLIEKQEMFDIIYIDGSHVRDDILVDSLLAWKILKVGGLIMWDDYRGAADWAPADRPRRAIDTFLSLHPEHEIAHVGYQLFARKIESAAGVAAYTRRWLRAGLRGMR